MFPLSVPPVAPAAQVEFLVKLQRLLHEGSFTSSYKFALLLAIADVCVEKGHDTGAEQPITTRELAERFVRLYWRQLIPYPALQGATSRASEGAGPAGAPTLLQNTGGQVELITLLRAEYDAPAVGGSLAKLRANPERWKKLLGRVAAKIEAMPLWKLQTVGGATLDFLYPNEPGAHAITLRPGVAFCFRQFHELVQDLVQGAWVRFLRELPKNQPLLGQATDLATFLFGSERTNLALYRPVLEDVQGRRCFYCEKALGVSVAVDHFIPWSLYPVDLGHNFVLAHEGCNGKKSHRLAAVEHLERWCARNATHAEELAERFTGSNLVHDLDVSQRVVAWAYGRAEAADAHVWRDDRQILVPLDPKWRQVLGIAA